MYADPYVDPTFTRQQQFGAPGMTHLGGAPAAGGYAAPVAAAPYPTYVAPYPTRSHSTKFKPLNCAAVLCALTIFAVCIASATVCWYHNNESFDATTTSATGSTTFTLNSTKSCYDLNGVNTESFISGSSNNARFVEYDSSTSTWSIFKLIQAFTLIALILAAILSIFLVICFSDSVRNRLLFMMGMNVLRIILLIIAVVILCSLIICFLAFVGITNAFNDDVSSCQRGYCKRFSDSVKEDRGTVTITQGGATTTATVQRLEEFGPDAGWFLDLAMIPIAIILCILVALNKFPIPVDSVGSGEAL